MSLHDILSDYGAGIIHYEAVQGGDISHSYCLHAPNVKYFLKVNDAALYPHMFEKEAEGLGALRENSTFIIPKVIRCGYAQKQQYLVLEWLEKSAPQQTLWQNFGTALAMLHQKPQPFFGWQQDNFIGSLVQHNQVHSTWHLFYQECRIMPLVKILFNAGVFSITDIASAELICKRIEQLFPPEPPSLIHGDLWSGNYMVAKNGCAAVFDPAVYYGHREMDIGMTKLFGGFHERFYDFYNDAYLLEKGWRQRVPLTQLYPLLVHAVLFGGHYVSNAREIMAEYQ